MTNFYNLDKYEARRLKYHIVYHVVCSMEVARNAVTIVIMFDKVSTFFVPKVTSSSGKKTSLHPV